ncbi:MAG TPA: hypothetical protein VGD81_10175 [Opitutaceae bacterium]
MMRPIAVNQRSAHNRQFSAAPGVFRSEFGFELPGHAAGLFRISSR